MHQKPSHCDPKPQLPASAPPPVVGTPLVSDPSAAPCTGFEGLVLPTPVPSETVIEKTAVKDAAKSTTTSPPSLTAGTVVKTALTSPAVWSGTGASVVCLDSSLVGVLGHGLSTLWSLRNELRQRGGESDTNGVHGDLIGRPGYLGLTLDALRSPGFNKIAAGVTYLGAGIEAGVRGRALESAVFSGYFIGCMAVVAVLNQSYKGTRSTSTLPERAFKAVWQTIPARVQNFLKDPGVYMTLGNGSLVVGTMNLESLSAAPLPTVVLGTGLALSSLGLVQSIVTFCRGSQSSKDQGNSVYLNGAANGLFGIASFMQGSPVVGAAKLCWAVSCTLLARMISSAPRRS